MFHTCLLIDTGRNPDRPRPGRRWLDNLYRVHQRLCMGFPTAARVETDAAFLHPFREQDFAAGHVHVDRAPESGFLFRVDPLPMGRAMIIVQSAAHPDWAYAFQNARHLLAAEPLVREDEPELVAGGVHRFRLRANTVRRVKPTEPGKDGPRVPVPSDRLVKWLDDRAAGFQLVVEPAISCGYAFMNKTGERGQGIRLRSVLYEGTLRVTDATVLRATLAAGIGPAKAFGFGLLSIAPR